MKLYFIRTTLLTLFFCSCDFNPGSYPYAEIYEFDVASEKELISAVEAFKEYHPEYDFSGYEGYADGRRKETDHWYHLWFYYPDENKVVKSWIRGNKLAFVGIGGSPNLEDYKEVNKDFSSKETLKEKEKFERLILNEIKKHIPSGEE